MEFTIERNILLEGIQKTLGIVERKTTMPILNNILVKTEENTIRISATDKEIGLTAHYSAQVKSPGEITVPARKVYEMIREIQGNEIHVETGENYRVVVSCGKVMYKISGLPADDFPHVFDESEEISFYPLKGKVLKELIEKTYFAMSADEMRKNLNGIFFEALGDGTKSVLQMVATDGHRLALAKTNVDEGECIVMEKGVILPRKGVNEIRKIVEDVTGDIAIGIRKGMCVVKAGDAILRVSLVDAEYPDYRRVIPSERGVVVELKKDEALRALRRMGVMANERYSGVILSLSPGKMILTSTNPDVGEAKEEMEIEYNERDLTVGYNVRYLIDAIEVIEEEGFLFEIGIGMRPGVIRPKEDEGYLCLIMPLKIQ